MAGINKEQEELGEQLNWLAPDHHKSCSQVNISDRKKALHGQSTSPESFATNESSHKVDHEKVTVSDSYEESPKTNDQKNTSCNVQVKLDDETNKDVGFKFKSDKNVAESYMESNENASIKTQESHRNEKTEFEETTEMDGFLSPEERAAVSQLALSQIARELDKRDNVSQDGNVERHLYTGPYGRTQSPFKKYSSFQGFPGGVKRSPRKLAGPAAKRTKLFHKGKSEFISSAESIKNNTTDKNSTKTVTEKVGSGGDTSDDDQWEIVEEDIPTEIDQALEDKSSKFRLSVMNVKSIIHKIITNESVVEMVRKAVLEEMDEYELKFEPKMTRSKLKEFEAQGQVSMNWGLSPQKKRDAANFLEMELPDDEEEDEDFTPTMSQESDEDSESVQSSYYSDIGSPMPSTPQSMPSTPTVKSNQCVSTPRQVDDDLSAHTDENSQNVVSPMGPPLQTIVPKSGGLGKKFQDSMEREKERSEEEAELIASRTRSKFPLKDCSILDIEASFVAPDITQDMYDSCDDLDWAEFLSTLITFPDSTKMSNLNTTIEEEDTEDDPEYNFQEEIDTLEYDTEDFRDDRGVKVSKKEMNMLLDDVLNNDEDYDAIDVLDEQYKFTIKTQSEKIMFNSNKKKQSQYQQSLISAIGEHERKQIDDQLRKHVQQLTQTYVMSQNGIAEHKPMGHTARFYLNELKNFAEKSEKLYGMSAYRASNLDMAICVVDDPLWQQEMEMPTNIKEKMEYLTFRHDSLTLPAFNYGQMLVMWTSPVFMFPDLLPQGGFFKQVDIKRDRARVKFLESEDNLLAMGLAQFSHLKKDAKDYIQRFMLPCKSRKQIEIRIKNLSAKAAKDNAVKFFRTYKRLPRFPQYAPHFDISMLKSPKDSQYHWDELPWWCRFFCTDDEGILNESVRDLWERQKEIKRQRKERLSVNFTLSESDIASMLTPPQSGTVKQQENTDSSVSGSSGSESVTTILSAKRPKRPYRKRLQTNKQKRNDMGIVGSFVPLPLPGSSIPQPQPSQLTICVLDNMQGISPVPNTTSPCLGSLPGNIATTSKNPTILVINKNVSIQPQNLNPGTCKSSAIYSQSSATFTHISTTQVPLSMPLICTGNSNSESELDTKSLTFEDICRPIMEAELAEVGVGPEDITEKELCKLSTENQSVCSLKSNANVVERVAGNSTVVHNVETVTTESISVPNVGLASSISGACINQSLNSNDLNAGTCEVQSSEISSTVLKNQIELSTLGEKIALHDMATSPYPIDDLEQQLTGQDNSDTALVLSVEDQKRDTTEGYSYTLMESRCTPTEDLNAKTIDDNELTSKQSHSSTYVPSSAEKDSTSPLQVVASLAQCFYSPTRATGSSQYSLEKTPVKRKLPALAPRSPSQRSVPISFTDLKSPRRKIKTSPRKKQLQQHVKTILPKGFVISSFDTSPAKKAASNLVDKAKHLVNNSKGFRQILPRPLNQPFSERDSQSMKMKKRHKAKGFGSISKQEQGSCTQSDSKTEYVHDHINENNCNANAEEDDRYGDTESDYTQSEDGNESQGTDGEDVDTQGTDDWEGTHETDGDSQDSQEEDSHIADLMEASTTIGFVPCRGDLYSVSRLGKKDRHRDLNLALLKPDIVVTDPQRDLRDTLFAQAYIHKVKKVLRDDVDKLEKFLRIMYNFTQDDSSPIKLYNDLQELFSNQPELIYDFASFLQAEQALECGCYKAYQEFNNARIFLRKLEIYFMKNPNQLQKVMRTFSRWYRKPGRKESDIREQIEPILKGQKLLLEEFSMFFPNERPVESGMEEFEEVDLDESWENENKDTSFEDINLLDMEEVYGTKRCPCDCHGVGDDTYRKRKKHCFSCCLTVIDGELVYKVNKTTIKKINVTYGTPVKISSLLEEDWCETTTKIVDSIDAESQEPDSTKGIAIETDNMEAVSEGCCLESETVEKDTFEHTSEETKYEKDGTRRKVIKGKFSNTKGLSLQRMANLSRNQPQEKLTKVSSKINENGVSSKLRGDQLCDGSKEDQRQNVQSMGKDKVKGNEIRVTANDDKMDCDILLESDHAVLKSQITKDISHDCKDREGKLFTVKSNKDDKSAEKTDDTLVSTFNSADKSINSMCFPSQMTENNQIEATDYSSVILHTLKNQDNANDRKNENNNSTALTSVITPSVLVSTPDVHKNLNVSIDSSFQRVPSSENRDSISKETSNRDTDILPEEDKTILDNRKEGLDSLIPCKVSKDDHVLEANKSPPSPSFSPGSPFAKEIQSITSVQSPLTTVQSPGVTTLLSSTGKARRITPIPIARSEEKSNSQSSFQTAMENSPVVHHFTTLSSPFGANEPQRNKSTDIFTNISSCSIDNTREFLSTVSNADLDTDSQKLSSSQKSSSNSADTLLSTTTNSESGFTKMIISQPDIFSENANVGFPKVSTSVTSSSLSHNDILSEESLFQCISKPQQFTETIPSVSNLTNILHALDDHSQDNLKHGQTEIISASPTKEVQTENNASLSAFVGSEGRSAFENINVSFEKLDKHKGKESPNKHVCGNEAGDNGKNQIVKVYPSFTRSETIPGESLRVSALSKNEPSVVSTPIVTEYMVKEKEIRKVNSSATEGATERQYRDKEKKHKMSRRELRKSLHGVVNEHENITSGDEILNVAYASGEKNNTENIDHKNEMLFKQEIDTTFENVNIKQDPSIKLSVDGPASLNVCKTKNRSTEIKSGGSDLLDNASISAVRSVSDFSRVLKKAKHSEIKQKSKKNKHQKKKRETENHESDSTQKADKKKKKAKRKLRREKVSRSVSENKKSTSSINKVQEMKEDEILEVSNNDERVTGMKGDDMRISVIQQEEKRTSEIISRKGTDEMISKNRLHTMEKSADEIISINKQEEKGVDEIITIDRLDETEVKEIIPNNRQEEKREDEMIPSDRLGEMGADELDWSKETDKTILENCKIHGIKDKTFAMIAKEIGNVSARQVRRRFDQLYQLIFGFPFGVKGNE